MIIKLSVLFFFIFNKCSREVRKTSLLFFHIYIYKYAHQYHLVEQFTSLNLQTYLGLNMVTVEGSKRQKRERAEDKKKRQRKDKTQTKDTRAKFMKKVMIMSVIIDSVIWGNFVLL